MNRARQYLELKGLGTTYWGKKIIAAIEERALIVANEHQRE